MTGKAIAAELGVSPPTVCYYLRRLGVPKQIQRKYDWAAVQAYYDAGHTGRECIRHFGMANKTFHDAIHRGVMFVRPREMPISELLSSVRSRHHLKQRLLKAGLLQAHCAECEIDSWRGAPLALQLHHINGIGTDNRLENLMLLCPNCHSQTENWGGRNKTRSLPKLTAVPAPVDEEDAA
ncbi:MAG TPA: HNH endonuclease [Baekduia sp.]|nr:HNH endonuclease [Baekduia sp.]